MQTIAATTDTAREEAVARAAQEGRCIDEYTFKRGLQELQPDLHFDLGAAHDAWHPGISERQGVFYKGKHICSMDRGSLPEFSIYDTKIGTIEVPIENVRAGEICAPMTLKPGYAYVRRPIKHRVLRVGWRHVIERLIRKKVPGITRHTVAAKFSVPVLYFNGPADELGN